MIRHAIDLIVGSAIILGVFALFSAPHVRAGECRQMVASHYGSESGNRTASGSYFDGTQMVAAHKTLPFGTKLRVSYKGKSVTVTVADRGPFVRGRQLDLSTAAARKIGLTKVGVGRVTACRVG